MTSIQFDVHDIQLDLSLLTEFKPWLVETTRAEDFEIEEISYVFTSDQFLLSLNQQYLKHDTLTDIITFDYSNQPKSIKGEIYISVERVMENAAEYKVDFLHELSRVMVHGILHLIGYSDKSSKQKNLMREKEDAYISLLKI